MAKETKFTLDSNLGIVKINGERINRVLEVNVKHEGGDRFGVVTLKFDADVEIEGSGFIIPTSRRKEDVINALKEDKKMSFKGKIDRNINLLLENIEEMLRNKIFYEDEYKCFYSLVESLDKLIALRENSFNLN